MVYSLEELSSRFSSVTRNINVLNDKIANIQTGSTGQSTSPILTLNVISNNQINLSWTTIPNVDGYILERSTSSNFSSPSIIYSGTSTSYQDNQLLPGTSYYYKINSYKGATTSGVSSSNSSFPYTLPLILSSGTAINAFPDTFPFSLS